MIQRALFFLVLNCLFNSCLLGQVKEIQLEGVANVYSIMDSIDFKVINNSNGNYLIDVGLEKCINNKWSIAKEDIFQCCSCMHTNHFSLRKHDKQDLKWSMSFLLNDTSCPIKLSNKMLRGKYRLRIYYTEKDVAESPQSIISKIFIIR